MKNLAISSEVPDGRAMVSTYRVQWSIATTTHRLPEEVVGSGPNRSIPTRSKGRWQGGRGCRSPGLGKGDDFRRWHGTHDFTYFWTVVYIRGQKYRLRRRSKVL